MTCIKKKKNYFIKDEGKKIPIWEALYIVLLFNTYEAPLFKLWKSQREFC